MRPGVPRLPGLVLLVGVLLVGCVPAAQPPPAAGTAVDEPVVFRALVAPFTDTLAELGVTIDAYQAYRYDGSDTAAFLVAVDTFYRANPGFCPLDEAFYPAASGLQFLTLAGNSGLEVRGFLYDQSHRPRLRYAYFSGAASAPLPAITCQTAPKEP